MIKIKRSHPRPAKLARVKSPETSKAYRSLEVRTALWHMQHRKCCYCEVDKLPRSGDGAAVEHFWPQGRYPGKKNVWTNLLLICRACNGRKLADFPLDPNEKPVLIDPSGRKMNPEIHLEFNVKWGEPDCGDVSGATFQGKETVRIIGLDSYDCMRERADLIYETVAEIGDLKNWEVKLQNEEPGAQAQVTKAEDKLVERAKNYSRYVATVRTIFRDRGLARLIK